MITFAYVDFWNLINFFLLVGQAYMDTELNSPPHEGGAAFKKPSSDGSGRKYRRRALADDGSSSSDG